ncbi:hypothetical protein SS50377_26600 [Spironucleus salmonicida]|uniref:Uncharacterized protein n=1 Tax=Spironucleus salmonicida TaxID=348837 RepID=V6LCP7_9EUKA|nr:hypothetical protein SS50377_26600 [Spironucleus salmonicida]|eukprot:EST41451.1 Hypothetical protein SS50377_19170 [Spironucleus salmonicida]
MDNNIFNAAQNQDRKYILNCAKAMHYDISESEYNDMLPSFAYSDTAESPRNPRTNSLFGSDSHRILEIFAPKTAKGEGKTDFSLLLTPKSARESSQKSTFHSKSPMPEIDDRGTEMRKKTVQLFQFARNISFRQEPGLAKQGTAQIALFDSSISSSSSCGELSAQELQELQEPQRLPFMGLKIEIPESTFCCNNAMPQLSGPAGACDAEFVFQPRPAAGLEMQRDAVRMLANVGLRGGRMRALSPLQLKMKQKQSLRK